MTRARLIPVPPPGRQAAEPPAKPADPADILARTLWGEARGEGADGMTAVAAVILNRVAVSTSRKGGSWWGNDVVGVCTTPWQFSCWNEDDPNRTKLLAVRESDPVFALALRIAREALEGGITDRTGGATHYHVAGLRPRWAVGRLPSARIGRHVFYKGIA